MTAEACPQCGASAGFEQREKGPHRGLFCGDCGAWVKWIRRTGARTEPVGATRPEKPIEPQKLKIKPAQLAHPKTMEERVAALEHDIGIVAQIVLGARK